MLQQIIILLLQCTSMKKVPIALIFSLIIVNVEG